MEEPSAGTYLIVTAGNLQIPLDRGSAWRIGRTEPSDVLIPDDRVSRNHAIVQRSQSGEYYLIDMGSTNGSFVNGSRISIPVSLRNGDRILIAEHELIFHCPAPPPAVSSVETVKIDENATRALFNTRLLTVLVADVRDFTKLTRLIDQAQLCQVIGTWFRQGGQIFQEHGSWAQKYIGDAIMAVWLHQDGVRAPGDVMGILRALAEFAQLSAGMQAQFNLPFEFRIGVGINSGLASIGNTGSGQLMDFTAMGDAVNAAFRLEAATKEIGMEVAVGRTTFDWLSERGKPGAYFQPRTVLLKGYEQPVQIWGVSLAGLREFVVSG
ncbi:MAG: adenylate/guanylate cyclase domain-containing protein [Acidobacteria bacterium]|nr:adenylate/guanylate cyclase domain-containing protein [Acidobacteriota bacterium]